MKNWKNDDDLLNLAFGELDDHAAQKLEASLLNDVDGQRELDLLKLLRSDMTELRDIPEMQFSKERLRDAILSAGAKPKRPAANWLNWLLAPVAVASIALVSFFALNGTEKPETRIVTRTEKPTVELRLPDGSSPTFMPDNPKSPTSMVPTASVEPRSTSSVPTVAKLKLKKKSRPSRIVRQGEPLVASMRGRAATRATFDTSIPNSGVAASAPTAGLASPRTRESAKAPEEVPAIVLIDTSTDSGAGAPVATEVTNPSNVVIGG